MTTSKIICLLLILVITGIISEPGACPEVETTSVKKSLEVGLCQGFLFV